jgi:hypothetical protein
MGKLVDVLKEDMYTAGRAGRGFVGGLVRGAYTPALLTTSFRQFNKFGKNGESLAEVVGDCIGEIVGASLAAISLAIYSSKHDDIMECIGALAITNILDYGVNIYRRSKK